MNGPGGYNFPSEQGPRTLLPPPPRPGPLRLPPLPPPPPQHSHQHQYCAPPRAAQPAPYLNQQALPSTSQSYIQPTNVQNAPQTLYNAHPIGRPHVPPSVQALYRPIVQQMPQGSVGQGFHNMPPRVNTGPVLNFLVSTSSGNFGSDRVPPPPPAPPSFAPPISSGLESVGVNVPVECPVLDHSCPPKQLEVSSQSHADSDMEMEDDITQPENDQGMNHSTRVTSCISDSACTEIDIKQELPATCLSAESNRPEEVLAGKEQFGGSSVLNEGPQALCSHSALVSRSQRAHSSVENSTMPAEVFVPKTIVKYDALPNDDGNSFEKQVATKAVNFEENSSLCAEGERQSSLLYASACGNSLECAAQPCNEKATPAIPSANNNSLSKDAELSSNSATKCVASPGAFLKEKSAEGTRSRAATDACVVEFQKKNAEKDSNFLSTQHKVDEFGRLARQGGSDSDSDDSCMGRRLRRKVRGRSRSRGRHSRRRHRSRSCSMSYSSSRSPSRSHGHRRTCSHSRSRSRSRNRGRSRSCSRGKSRSRSRSRSPSPPSRRRKNYSSFSRRGRRSRSRSWSPVDRRHNMVRDNIRRGRGQIGQCFNFMRGRCYRGPSCRFSHHVSESNDGPVRHRNKQEYVQAAYVPNASRNNEEVKPIRKDVPEYKDDRVLEEMPLCQDTRGCSSGPASDRITNPKWEDSEKIKAGSYREFSVKEQASSIPQIQEQVPSTLNDGFQEAKKHGDQLREDFGARLGTVVPLEKPGIQHNHPNLVSNNPYLPQQSGGSSLLHVSPPFAQGYYPTTNGLQSSSTVNRSGLHGHSLVGGFHQQTYRPMHSSHEQVPQFSMPIYHMPNQQFPVQLPVHGANSYVLGNTKAEPYQRESQTFGKQFTSSSQVHPFSLPQCPTFDTSRPFMGNIYNPPENISSSMRYAPDVRKTGYGGVHSSSAHAHSEGQGTSSTGLKQAGFPVPHNLESGGKTYDPLFDSIEPSSNLSMKSNHAQKSEQPVDSGGIMRLSGSSKAPDAEENNKRKEVEAVLPVASANHEQCGENGDAEVGSVENVSQNTSGDPANSESSEIEISQRNSPGSRKHNKESRSMRLFKVVLAAFVKDVLKPSWRQGNMSKEAFKTIVKKTVEKVSGTMKGRRIPKSRDKINQYIDSSQQKLTKLIMGYVDKYAKA